MKRTLLLVTCMIFAVSFTFSQQSNKDLKKQLKENAIKSAQKEAKKLTKDGWKVLPGEPPMDKQLEASWVNQLVTDDNGNPKYITSTGNGVAETQQAAMAQALELGKLTLAGMVETNIASIINANLANSQVSTKDATSVTEIVQSSKNIIAQQLGYVNPAFKIYRDLKDKKIEVQVRLFYESAQSLVIAKKAIKQELKDKLKKTDAEVNKLVDGGAK